MKNMTNLGSPPVGQELSDFIPYSLHSIGEAEIAEVVSTLKSNWLTSGPLTLRFEKEFAEYIGCRYAVAVSSCTAGLHLALNVYGIGPGDEVITTPLTFCATAEVIEYQQAKPVFVDIDPHTFNIDPALIEERITSRTKAIIPVHYGGIPCDMSAILDIATRHGLHVIEDAAHAIGSMFKYNKIGNLGNPAVFSFYPTKNMTTGEGGMITTSDGKIAEMLKILSLHGISRDAWKRYSNHGQWHYEIRYLGYKYNFTDLQAAIGVQQLKKVDTFNATREQYARIYFEALNEIPELKTPNWYGLYFGELSNCGFKNCWHLFVIMLQLNKLKIGRDQFIEELKSRGIGTSVHFIPLHLQPYYAQKYGYQEGDFRQAETIYSKIISLPLYPKLKIEGIRRVIDVLKELIDEFRI